MKKKVLSAFLLFVFLLAACGKEEEKVTEPFSSELVSEEEGEESEPVDSDTTDEESEPQKAEYEVTGGEGVYQDLLGDNGGSGSGSFQVEVTKNKNRNTLNTPWRKINDCPATSVVEEEAAAMRNAVLSTGNTSQYYTWTGKTYYVSPDGDDKNDGMTPQTAIKTLDADAYYMNPPKKGDAVLFERGGIWRMTERVKAFEGVIYGSYGTGPKPALYGSPRNYANAKYWIASNKQNVWKIAIATQDVGNIVFNEGELVGTKKFNGITVLEKNGDYYYNNRDDTLYLYFDKGNPGKYYKDIELALKVTAIQVSRDDVVVDNLCIKYYGHNGVNCCDNDNLKVTNCEFGFIGGCIQSGLLRFGNCIQQWNSTEKQLIENNWMYQPYDTGYTWQGSDITEPGYNDKGELRIGDKVYYNNITVRKNIIEYCNYAIEFWHNTSAAEKETDPYFQPAHVNNFVLSDNMFRYNGYGWGGIQRPDKWGYAIYAGGKTEFRNAKNCFIQNNVFDMARRVLIRWEQSGGYNGEWTISGNSFYQTGNQYGEAMALLRQYMASSQDGLQTAAAAFDPNYKTVKWLEND